MSDTDTGVQNVFCVKKSSLQTGMFTQFTLVFMSHHWYT